MNTKSKAGLEILLVAVVLGLLGDTLLRQTPWGLNVLVFNLAFAGGVFALLKRHAAERLTTHTYALLGVLVFFASMFVWRDAIELRVADTFAIVTILGVLFLPTLRVSAPVAGVVHYVVGVVWAAVNSFFAAVALLAADISWGASLSSGWRKHALSVFKGVLVAAPLILIFGGLFMAADAMYEGWVKANLSINFEDVISHVLLFSFFGWMTAGYLRGAIFFSTEKAAAQQSPIPAREETVPITESTEASVTLPEGRTAFEHINISDPPGVSSPHVSKGSVTEEVNATEPRAETRPVGSVRNPAEDNKKDQKRVWDWANIDNSWMPGFTLGSVEIGVILGLVNLLFLSFTIFQIPYLFGGFEHVQTTPELGLAEYARRGFGELVAVSALVLPLLLVLHWLIKRDDKFAGTLFKILAGAQIGLLFVIMASAVQRLVILTGPLGYGLTTVRLYPMIFMSWLAIVFILFCATVLRGARNRFAWAALWSAFLVLGATHVLNPDALIVKTNIALMKQGRDFDPYYNNGLSDDAIPALIEEFPNFSEDTQTIIYRSLANRNCRKKLETDLRSFNFGRRAASDALQPFDEVFTSFVSECNWDTHH